MRLDAKLAIYDKHTRMLLRTIDVLPATPERPNHHDLAEPVTLAENELAFFWIKEHTHLVPWNFGAGSSPSGLSVVPRATVSASVSTFLSAPEYADLLYGVDPKSDPTDPRDAGL